MSELMFMIMMLVLTFGIMLGYLELAMQIRVLKANQQVDLERGPVLVNPIYPDRTIPLTCFPPQESYQKTPPPSQLPLPAPPSQAPIQNPNIGTVVGNPIFS